MPDKLATIGTFSMLTGRNCQSIPTLRHYDEIGLMRPAEVDPRTSYRRYSYAQVDIARRILLATAWCCGKARADLGPLVRLTARRG